MVRMSDVWDRASDVIARRRGDLASIALLFLWLPGLLRTVAGIAVRGTASAPIVGSGGLVIGLLGLAVAALGLLGHLAIVAVASDPATGRGQALAIARRRFWPAVGIAAIVVVAVALLLMPVLIALGSAYSDIAAMSAGVPPRLSAGTGLFILFYSVALAVVILWVEARLLVLTPVIVNERLGLGSFRRAWALTRGLTWRIVGVLLLFGVVALVAVLAVQGVVGVALRLLLGAGQAGLALFLTSAAVSLVGCVISVVAAAFTAQLYVARAGGWARG